MQHHGAALRALGEEEAVIEALATDWRSAEVGEELRSLLAYAERLTLDPGSVRKSEVDALREAGREDEAILHACEVVAYFNFVNRLADGLGVRLEPGWDAPLIDPDPGEATKPPEAGGASPAGDA